MTQLVYVLNVHGHRLVPALSTLDTMYRIMMQTVHRVVTFIYVRTDLTRMVSVNNIPIMSVLVSRASSFISNVIIGLNCAVYSVGFVRTVDL